jgi:hypothetical protein
LKHRHAIISLSAISLEALRDEEAEYISSRLAYHEVAVTADSNSRMKNHGRFEINSKLPESMIPDTYSTLADIHDSLNKYGITWDYFSVSDVHPMMSL